MALSLNKQKEKEWDNIIKQEAKANGWKFKGWFAYKAVKDFFYEATFYTSGFDSSVSGSLEFKPLIIDDTFWEIVDLNDNRKTPLSFRGNGAFVVCSKDVYDYKLKVVPETLKADISNLLHKINSKVDELSSTVSNIDNFVQFVEQHPSKRSEWFDSDLLIVSSIVQKNYDKALSLLDYAKKTRGMCGWSFGDKDFYDLAIEFCQKHQ
ncbi:MAG: hypothetical protein JNK27_11410 [Chitinophagaceae bacterium]|nr:hypothetical protein [Chitinophagaceae bacterium]